MTMAFTPPHCYEMWEHIRRNPDCKKRRCVYVEVLSENLEKPYISICVKDPSKGCKIGFGSGKLSEVTENHVAGVDSAVVQCDGAELKIELTCLKQGSSAKNFHVEPYDGPTSIAIRVWWGKCVRITFDDKSYCVCPQQFTPSQQQGTRRGLREIVGEILRKIGKLFRETFCKLRLRHNVETKAEEHTSPSRRGDAAEK